MKKPRHAGKPSLTQTEQNDTTAASTQQPVTAVAKSVDGQPQAQSQPQTQVQIDPQLMAKALALAKAQTPQAPAQDASAASTTNASTSTPTTPAAQTSLLDRAGASFQKVGVSLQNTLDDALSLIGIRYRMGGTTPETGFDCSGFVVHVFREGMGLILPRTSRELSKVGEIVKKQDLQPGDLVFFNTMRRTFSHVGIYLGNGQFIHAPRTGSEVRIEDMRESYWVKRYEGARRMEVSE
ncbi:MAG TPA: C40 family peptidase [Rhodocyclaceae bacterium]|nr:C40 family peptidase [Rhodocyclaceae bacterium]